MVSTVEDLVVAIEAMMNAVYVGFAVLGVRYLFQRFLPVGAGLLVGIVVGTVLYDLGTVNVGTAVRHRQMVLWVIFIFGGIGISTRFEFRSAD